MEFGKTLHELQVIVEAAGGGAATYRLAAELIRQSRDYRWVALYEVTANEIAAIAWTGTEAPAHPRFPITSGLNGAAVRTGMMVLVQDVTKDPRYLTTFGSTRSEIIIPIRSRRSGIVVGTIDVESERTNVFTAEDQVLLESCAAVLAPLWS
jgi:L-methionine (R)-S-oxide reductase